MNTSTAKELLQSKRQYWEAVAEHASEGATEDSQVSFTFHFALQNINAVKRNEKRVILGVFGRCERCGATIDDGRLENILDSEWHYCAVCASKPVNRCSERKPTYSLNGQRIAVSRLPSFAIGGAA